MPKASFVSTNETESHLVLLSHFDLLMPLLLLTPELPFLHPFFRLRGYLYLVVLQFGTLITLSKIFLAFFVLKCLIRWRSQLIYCGFCRKKLSEISHQKVSSRIINRVKVLTRDLNTRVFFSDILSCVLGFVCARSPSFNFAVLALEDVPMWTGMVKTTDPQSNCRSDFIKSNKWLQ